jgi:hypothetical protein
MRGVFSTYGSDPDFELKGEHRNEAGGAWCDGRDAAGVLQ